ncbi:hypothetical protein F4782DRAFT_108458 [Xylaria castorea]|nr:hypothetical protein F4782DRAFT_108458 [Xylaria castorea]
MPPHRYQIGEPQDDTGIWKQNETALRRLYLRERKTLKDVKRVMESEHGFPTTPLSTYESKLRDLGLRKKMKRKDWHPIYRHYMNSGQRHTAIYFNGTRIPWDKAWKEIRRSGARECNDGDKFRLPADVVMRSPSPGLESRRAIPSCRVPIPWHLSDISLVALSPTAMVHRLRLYEIPSNLLRMKMLNVFQQPLTTVRVESDRSSYDHHSQLNTTNLGIESALLDQYSRLLHQNSEHLDIDSYIDKWSSALYLLANNEVRWHLPGTSLDESLELIINKTPKYVLLKVLENESDSPTVQAAVETLGRAFTHLSRKDDFLSLIEVICRFHPNWNFHDRYLGFAGRLGCVDSCRLLLQRRPEGNLFNNGHGNYYIRAVLDSIAKGNVECAKIMFAHVFESRGALLQPRNFLIEQIFWSFLFAVAKGSYELELGNDVPFGRQTPAVQHMLEWFLEVGANVDLYASLPRYLSARYGPIRYLSTRYLSATCRSLGFVPVKSSKNVLYSYYTMFTPRNWMPTTLDYLYFENPELYSYLVDHSTRYKTEVIRSGIHRSAREGIKFLRTYLLSRLSHTPAEQDELLEICLTEEFLRPETHDHVDFNVIGTLLDYHIGLEKFRLKLSASTMLYYAIKAASQQGMHPAVYHIVKTLIHKGAVISAETMDEAVEMEGTTLLQLLSSYGADLENQGAMALCTAIKLDNYEAVNLLLNIGVDVNATLQGCEQRKEITILAHAHVHMPERINLSLYNVIPEIMYQAIPPISGKMLEYLIFRNVKLREHPGDPDPHRLLHLILRHGLESGGWESTVNKIKLLLDTELLISDQPRTSPCLLEACFQNKIGSGVSGPQRLSLLNYLIDHGISVSHSGVLACLIHFHAPEDQILNLLKSGVDVNAYCWEYSINDRYERKYTPLQAAADIGSLDLVRLLVRRGAEVNRPAKRYRGRTALQAACERVSHEGGRSRIIDLVKFLIARGANVNAPPAALEGVAALQAAAGTGNFEVVLLLLNNGADINGPPAAEDGFCALDRSAAFGKLDMVQFLLDLGALSYQGGESGYKGAIRCAEESTYSSIANMIRQHALKNGKSGQELFAHHRQWEDASSTDGDDSDDTDEIGDAWFENEDFWEDWLPF